MARISFFAIRSVDEPPSGEIRVREKGEEITLAISGGFLEVLPDRVIILADAAERDEEIDLARAEAAKRRAQERLSHPTPETDMARAEASLSRALARIKVAEKRRRRGGGGAGTM